MMQFFTKILGGKASKKSQTPRMRIHPRLEELEQRALLSATHAMATLSTTSTNWSGFAVETNLNSPQNNAVSAVSGSWTVPTATGSGTAYSSVWVGIDGYSSSTVEQIGVEADVTGGKASYYAWYEMYPAYPVTISSVPVTPGDSISASVSYASGQYTLQLSDNTTGKSYSTVQALAGAQRSSAEWIVEAPSSGFGVLPLANFGTVNFTNSSATVNGTTGPIDSSSWQDALINMSSRSTTEDKTSAVTDSTTTVGTSTVTTSAFAVTYSVPTTQPAPPPQRHHSWWWWFANNMPSDNSGAATAAAAASSTSMSMPLAIQPAATFSGPGAVRQAMLTGQNEAFTASPVTVVATPNPGASSITIRAGESQDLATDNADNADSDTSAFHEAPAELSTPRSAADLGTSASWISSITPADPLPASVLDNVFGSYFAGDESSQDLQELTGDSPAALQLMGGVGLALFVTDWYLGAQKESVERNPSRSTRSM